MMISIFFCFSTLKGENIDFTLFNNNDANELYSNKTYLYFDQIIVTANGMFINLEDNILPINRIYYDENGYFTGNVTLKNCDEGHPQVCLDCHGCAHKKCIYHCSCVGGPRQD